MQGVGLAVPVKGPRHHHRNVARSEIQGAAASADAHNPMRALFALSCRSAKRGSLRNRHSFLLVIVSQIIQAKNRRNAMRVIIRGEICIVLSSVGEAGIKSAALKAASAPSSSHLNPSRRRRGSGGRNELRLVLSRHVSRRSANEPFLSE